FNHRSTNAEYISHFHQHNFSCVDWKQAPEATAGNCTRYGSYGALRCYGGMNNLPSIPEQKVRKLEEIIFCGWPENVFNPLIDLQPFPKIRTLTIEYSNFTEIIFDFPEMFYLQTINISWTNLSHISSRTFKRVHTLKVADLRWNQLIQMEGPLILPRYFEKLYLAGNPWNCTRNFKWLLLPEQGAAVVDRGELLCADRKYKDRLMLAVMHYKLLLKEECQSHPDLQNCTCIMHHIIPKSHIPLYTVNCSNLNFQRLPAYIPANTTMLFLNNNQITDVLPLRNNVNYRHVVDVHLDNNLVESIDVLEGGYWLEHFRLLSLRGNKLRKLPVYALDNALEDNANANLLLLSMNPWFCSCKFAMSFRETLIKYNSILRDSWNITCTYQQGDDLRQAKVLSITRQDVCKLNEDPKVHPLDMLNGVLASLILFILGKLAYDYYHYKYYGRVPWIVMKLP
ncbi:protein singed wings 2-like, partial [Teleopsis dalmanni]|uniref:protein singed wings 2-like n=1 Tax=Teleopsis dalmanni TaxID=139649 RepID=UPI0018CD6778